MQHKSNKWYADWRDEHGRRHRKAFATRRAALQHQTKMQRQAAAKKAPAYAAAPPPSSRPTLKRGHAAAIRPGSRAS